METKIKLDVIEKEKNIYLAVNLIESASNDEKTMDVYLRVLFVLLDFLVDGNYTEDEHTFGSLKIKQVYDEAKSKYATNSDFLFFSGTMIYIAEWYFDVRDLKEAAFMLEKAMYSDPDNILYKWGYVSITDQRAEVNREEKFFLSQQILQDKRIIENIKYMGMLGKYLLGIIESTYDSTKMK